MSCGGSFIACTVVGTAQQRIQTDSFSIDVDVPGLVDVTNESYENPAEHQYVVSLDDAMACACPHYVHRNAFCKHRAAVENTTDEGTLEAFPSEDNEDDVESEDCDCEGLNDFPCWPCVRMEF